MKWCFRIYLIVVSLCAFVIAADPSVPQAGGKQYAEVINGNNALIMPADRANPHLYGGPEVAAIKRSEERRVGKECDGLGIARGGAAE